jgi:hypothetical protein
VTKFSESTSRIHKEIICSIARICTIVKLLNMHRMERLLSYCGKKKEKKKKNKDRTPPPPSKKRKRKKSPR